VTKYDDSKKRQKVYVCVFMSERERETGERREIEGEKRERE